MKGVRTFGGYISYVEKLYREDPLLVIANGLGRSVPSPNDYMLLCVPRSKVHSMLRDMNLSPEPISRYHEKARVWRPPWSLTEKTYLHEDWVLDEHDGVRVQLESLSEVHVVNLIDGPDHKIVASDPEEGGQCDRVIGVLPVELHLIIHPYSPLGSNRPYVPDPRAEFYRRVASKRIGSTTVGELTKGTLYSDYHRRFAEHLLQLLRRLSAEPESAAYGNFKSRGLDAVHHMRASRRTAH